jgi:hypothetical protein
VIRPDKSPIEVGLADGDHERDNSINGVPVSFGTKPCLKIEEDALIVPLLQMDDKLMTEAQMTSFVESLPTETQDAHQDEAPPEEKI